MFCVVQKCAKKAYGQAGRPLKALGLRHINPIVLDGNIITLVYFIGSMVP